MSTQTTNLLSALLLPILILLGIGIVVLVVWLILAVTRPRKETAPADTENRSKLGGARQASDFVSINRRSQEAWEIRIEGQSYPTLEAVPDRETRAEVLSALREMASFAGYPRQGAASQPARRSEDADQRTHGPSSSTGSIPTAGERERRLAAATATVPQERRGLPEMPTIDLAHEIQEIVEEMQSRRPSLLGHAVNLQNLPGRGIAFVVDGVIYQEVTDIPDPEIQTLIRDATKEWERR